MTFERAPMLLTVGKKGLKKLACSRQCGQWLAGAELKSEPSPERDSPSPRCKVLARARISTRRCVTPSGHEWNTLCDVERQLLAAKPESVLRFEARQTRLSGHPRKLRARIALIVGLLLGALMLVTGSASGALAFLTATTVIWVAWSCFGETGPRRT
jgi:DUF3040 family protein